MSQSRGLSETRLNRLRQEISRITHKPTRWRLQKLLAQGELTCLGRAEHKARRKSLRGAERQRAIEAAESRLDRRLGHTKEERKAAKLARAQAAEAADAARRAEGRRKAAEEWGTSPRHLPHVMAFHLEPGSSSVQAQRQAFIGMQQVFFGLLGRKRTLHTAASRALRAAKVAFTMAQHASFISRLDEWHKAGCYGPKPELSFTWAGRTMAQWLLWARKVVGQFLACTIEHAQASACFDVPELSSPVRRLLLIEGNGGLAVRLTNRLRRKVVVGTEGGNDAMLRVTLLAA